MNTSTLKTGLALLSTGWTVVAGAETLIHYHLDDLAVGTRGTKDTVFVNAANPGTRDGKAVTFNGGEQTDSTWLYPIGTNGLPEVWRYFDPVKNAAHDAGRAVFVKFNNSSQYNWSAAVNADAVALSSFTVETYFRYVDLWGDKKKIWQTLLYKKPSTASSALQVLILNGRLLFYVGAKQVLTSPGTYNDEQWHHVACTYDKGANVLKIYADYKLLKEVTLDSGVSLAGDGESFYAGLRGPDGSSGYATFTGSLAEFRLSDTVLTPAQFIRAEKGDGSTLAWLAPGVAAEPVPPQPDLSHSAYTLSDDVDGATLYDGAFDATGVAGRKSFAFSGDSNAGGFVVTDVERSFAVNSFTAEIGFKFPQEAWRGFSEDCVYLFCHSGQWYVWCKQTDGRIDVLDSTYKRVATLPATAWDDGAWHRLAVVSDRENTETRVYLDGRLVARAASVLGRAAETIADKIYVNCGCWGGYTAYSCKSGNLNDIRLTRKALKPSEFLMTKRVDGETLVWAPFDDKSDALVEAFVEAPSLSGAATLVGANAGELRDADGNRLREKNRGSLSLRSGAGAYSRLSLLERPDQTVELFLRGSADVGTDLVALQGVTGGQANAVWSLRQTADGLKVIVAGQDVASASQLSEEWSHIAIVFAPSADGATTSVTVYRDYEVAGTGAFSGALAVDGLADSSLAFGAFMGNVDEVRVTRGTLAPEKFLRAHCLGFAVIVR